MDWLMNVLSYAKQLKAANTGIVCFCQNNLQCVFSACSDSSLDDRRLE